MKPSRQAALVRAWLPAWARSELPAEPAVLAKTSAQPAFAVPAQPTITDRIAALAAEGVKRMTNLLNTKSRQQQRLADLKAARLELLGEHDRAVANGDDATLEKIAAKLARNQLDTAAAQAAIDTADRLAKDEKEAAEREKREQVLKAVRAAESLYRDRAVEFERDVMALADRWPAVQAAFEDYRGKAVEAHVETLATRGLAPGAVWSRVWTRFLGAVKDPGRAPLVMPKGGPVSSTYPTIAESFAKEYRAATASPQSEKESAV